MMIGQRKNIQTYQNSVDQRCDNELQWSWEKNITWCMCRNIKYFNKYLPNTSWWETSMEWSKFANIWQMIVEWVTPIAFRQIIVNDMYTRASLCIWYLLNFRQMIADDMLHQLARASSLSDIFNVFCYMWSFLIHWKFSATCEVFWYIVHSMFSFALEVFWYICTRESSLSDIFKVFCTCEVFWCINGFLIDV